MRWQLLRVLDESTVLDEAGRYRFVSEQIFSGLTKAGDRCFVCLTAPGMETQEHVIPKWIIKQCDLHTQTIGLTNGESVMYSRYKIPCCWNCNQALSRTYEIPISHAIKSGFSSLKELHLSDPTLIMRWLNLLFYKTHYKDLFLRWTPDRRSKDGMIGDAYDWGVMALPHALFSSPFTDTLLEKRNIGSLVVIKLLNPEWAGPWDYRDDFLSGTVYVRVGDTVIIGILNDGGITSNSMVGRFNIEAGAYVMQTLEILTDYQVFNFGLGSRPDYIKRWIAEQDYTGIGVDLPNTIAVEIMAPEKRHKMLWAHLKPFENLSLSDGRLVIDSKDKLLAGQVSLCLNPQPAVRARDSDILASLRSKQDTAIFYGS